MTMTEPQTDFVDAAIPWVGPFRLCADTRPGATGPLAAPHASLSAQAYRQVIRQRFLDPANRQHLVLIARHVRGDRYREAVPVTGPFAEEARAILLAIVAGSA